MRRLPLAALLLPVLLPAVFAAAPALALDEAHAAKAETSAKSAVEYLLASQDEAGSWAAAMPGPDGTPNPNPGCVGVTGLALMALLDHGVAPDHAAVKKAVAFLLAQRQPTGEFGQGALQNYNTSVAVSALARLQKNDPACAEGVKAGVGFLTGKQWSGGMKDPKGAQVDEKHPFFGGAGYGGKHGRPDMSNTNFMVQALHDAQVEASDPAYARAVEFLHRCQGVPSNKANGDKIAADGGFIYSTSVNQDLIGVPQSEASPDAIAAAKKGETNVSGLRTYGSMTYAGFKSYLYAKLSRDDERVKAAFGWIRANYTFARNPGLPVDAARGTEKQGLYYYYLTAAKALSAWGEPKLTLADGRQVDWQNDLTDTLAAAQKADGSWTNPQDRWYEGDPRLVTAYGLIALNNIRGRDTAGTTSGK